ncbi:hypothetical protein COV19_02320 [Candidatus Woesearchaeota archaeon CG10_big_fil_rev_8_21_14_0_10_44_13]|nr:MAG: hypothetical protein COV19_02320 [Candidatus Woesearchaeota archaeon CG10_big_fil_rev_8_21_14_0_10_44_13]
MDVEQMQKINKLARELMQHGIAPDMEEATKQAELMINKGDNSISEVIRPNSTKRPEERQQVQQREERSDNEGAVIMELRKLATQLGEQSRTIKSLKEQLDGVKDEMGKLKAMKTHQPVMIKQPFEEQVHLKKEEVKKDEPHPRVGAYASEDVSIEKFFYSGPPK